MAWYDNAVFYHIYPLGLCGCPHENNGEEGSHFPKITEWTEHAQRIGMNAVYIGPLFESGSHGYDTIDYRRVDRRIGTNEDFKAYVRHCHDIGIKVIVDGVFNHTGRGFFAFQDIRTWRENSIYRDWYCNVNFWGNNEYNDGFSYDNWGGHNLLVKLNVWNPKVREYLFDTVRFWITEFDIDGIRLDAADVLDFNFMRDLRGVCDSMKRDFWLMGEVIHGDYSRWANEGMLHSVTNYELHKGLYSGHNDHNYFEIAHSVKRLLGIVGTKIRLYTFVDNHDVARIWSKLNNKEHMANVHMLLYMLPGIPSVYYGSEFGIAGDKQYGSDWNLRPCLDLSDFDENADLPKLLKALGRIKRDFPEATWGEYKELSLTTRQYAFGRILDGRAIITALNNDDTPVHMEIPLPVNADRAVNLLTLPENTGETDSEAEKQRLLFMTSAKEALISQSEALYEASGNIRERTRDLRKAAKKIKTDGAPLTEQVGEQLNALRSSVSELLNLVDAFEESSGKKHEASSGSLEGCRTLEIRDGRLVVDLAPNSGVVAFVNRD